MNKRQAFMEWLMQYGWAILIVIVAIGALAFFGVLDFTLFLPREEIDVGNKDCDWLEQIIWLYRTDPPSVGWVTEKEFDGYNNEQYKNLKQAWEEKECER